MKYKRRFASCRYGFGSYSRSGTNIGACSKLERSEDYCDGGNEYLEMCFGCPYCTGWRKRKTWTKEDELDQQEFDTEEESATV